MKKQFFKLVSVVIVLLCASISMSAAVDWSNYAFIGDGTGSGKYANKYKVETVEGLNVVNIQRPWSDKEEGIYMTVSAGITSCSVASAIQGAGVLVYLSALTAMETEVTIKYDTSKEITFHIYYADGSSGTKQASDLTLTAPATTILDLQIGDDFTIKYTTSSRGAVTFSSSNTDAATVSADGVITALAAGTTIITVSQAEDETYNAGSKSFTLSVIESVIDKPQMISASLERVDMNNAYVRVSATDAVTPFADLTYDCSLTQGENVYPFTISATDGILHIEKMPACAGHTLEIWAINKAGKKSDNSARVDFTTECETTGLWLAGSMNALSDGNWNPRDDNYQFRKTKIAGVYSLTKHLKKGSYVYKLTEGSWDNGKCTQDDHHLVLSEDMDVTFYARGVNNFASSADSIFLIGTATSGFLPESAAWDCKTNGKYCKWNEEHTSAIWTGNVYGVSGDTKGEYKIVKIAYLNGTGTNMPYVYWSDLLKDNQTISGVSESSTKASFIFDLPTLSWSWHEVYAGQCTFSGTKGDGQTSNGSTTFTKGYNLSLYLNAEKTLIHITAEFLDDETPPFACVQNYPTRIETEERNEFTLAQRQGTKIFDGDIPVSELKNKADGIIRFGVKFAFDGGLRVTTPEFYYLDGSGCAERDFVIYHHSQTPANPEKEAVGAVESFAGGRILQPIQYKRRLRPDVWETLSIPFEVDSVTVTDEDGVYKIYPQYDNNGKVTEGEFWLRDFREKEVSAEDFQKNWHDIQATTAKDALPKKNVPYIIRVPDDDFHYWADKYIVFHGASYQTIDDVYSTDVQTPRATEMFAYSGNNTMKEWKLRSAYVLDDVGEYFRSGETVTLYPFECAVNAEQATIAKMPRLSLNKRPDTATDTKIPTTAMEAGSVWTLMGGYVGAFGNVDEYDALLQRLPEGVYIVSRGEQADKLYLVK